MLSSIMNRAQSGGAPNNFSSMLGRVSTYGWRGAEGRDVWARPGMAVTFRAELMPGRDRAERTFRVTRVLPSRRVTIEGIAGEHTAAEFESR